MKTKNKFKKFIFKNDGLIQIKKLSGIFHPLNLQTAFQTLFGGDLSFDPTFPNVQQSH